MNRTKKIALLTIIIGLFIGLGYSQIMGGGYGLRYLGLSDEQWEAINKLRLEHQKEMINLRSELDKAYLELDNLYNQNDTKKVKTQLEKINKIKTEMDKKIVEFREKVNSRLTPEQQRIFNSYNYRMGTCGYYGRGMRNYDGPGYWKYHNMSGRHYGNCNRIWY